MQEPDLATMMLSIVITWTIGLVPPLVIRYGIARRPIGKWPAIGIATAFWFFNLILFVALGSKSKTHFALYLIAWVSYLILRRGTVDGKQSNEVRPSSADDGVSKARPDIASLSSQARPDASERISSDLTVTEASPKASGQAQRVKPTGSANSTNDELYYSRAFLELESNELVTGMWAKCFAEAEGDLNKAKAAYIKRRAEQLSSEAKLIERQREAEELEAQRRSIAAEGTRLEELRFGNYSRATLEECIHILNEVGYRVDSTLDGYKVKSPNSWLPDHELKGPEEMKRFINKRITCSSATDDESVEYLKKCGCAVLKSNSLWRVTLPNGEKKILDSGKDVGKLVWRIQTRGKCPNCDSDIPLNSSECPKCNAVFSDASGWRVRPYIDG